MINTNNRTIAELVPSLFHYVSPQPFGASFSKLLDLTRQIELSSSLHPTLMGYLTPEGTSRRIAPHGFTSDILCPVYRTEAFVIEILTSRDGYEIDSIVHREAGTLYENGEVVLDLSEPYWEEFYRVVDGLEEESQILTLRAREQALRDAENLREVLLASPDLLSTLNTFAALSKKLSKS